MTSRETGEGSHGYARGVDLHWLGCGLRSECRWDCGSWIIDPPIYRPDRESTDGFEVSASASVSQLNSKPFTINNVNDLNLLSSNPLGANPLNPGNCTACHDSPDVGSHSKVLPLNIGDADTNPPALNVIGLPTLAVKCTDATGPLAGQGFIVTDLGRAFIGGKCADLGWVKGSILRGLAARAPYFHNVSAAMLKIALLGYFGTMNP